MHTQLPQVGAPIPDLDTSPILGEEEEVEAEPNVPPGTCTFNGATYGVGDLVMSGHELLRCEAPGVWVRLGERAHPHGHR